MCALMQHRWTAFIAGLAVGVSTGAALTYWAARCRQNRHQPKSHDTPNLMHDVMQDDILREHFTRTIQFFGEDAQQSLANSLVVVVGLGVRSNDVTTWLMITTCIRGLEVTQRTCCYVLVSVDCASLTLTSCPSRLSTDMPLPRVPTSGSPRPLSWLHTSRWGNLGDRWPGAAMITPPRPGHSSRGTCGSYGCHVHC